MLAWQIERISIMATKKDRRELPRLKDLLKKKNEPQSFEEQKAVFYQIAAQLGAKVKTIPRTHGQG